MHLGKLELGSLPKVTYESLYRLLGTCETVVPDVKQCLFRSYCQTLCTLTAQASLPLVSTPFRLLKGGLTAYSEDRCVLIDQTFHIREPLLFDEFVSNFINAIFIT